MKRFNVIKILALFRQILLFCFLMILANISVAQSELTHDPTIDPIPTFDYDTTEKAVVIRFDFISPLTAEFVSLEITPGPGLSHLGEPLHLYTELLDLNSNVITEFNLWHPLWVISFDEGGKEHLTVRSAGSAAISFPFRPDIAIIKITNVETGKDLITEDLVPHFHDFCRANPDDPDCDGIVNRSPTCDANGPYFEECTGPTTSVALDGSNSIDPDDDPLTYDWNGPFTGNTTTGATPTVEFSNYGDYTVSLEVNDDFGGSAMCNAQVQIIDTTPPEIYCNAPLTIVPSDAPVAYTGTATDTCDGQIEPVISGFDCYKLSKKGKRIDKTESCIVSFEGAALSIQDSGGIDDIITWSLSVRDNNGNQAIKECKIQVIKKK
ncbi:MAG: PKD domain-containing protein [Chloroflexota bacterium]|nr:MAG: PKD domain-containing protein [Chloroflexota bacterium]